MSDAILNEIFGKKKVSSLSADELKHQWEKAGKPRDVESIRKILAQAGMKEKHINNALQVNNIKPTASLPQEIKSVDDITTIAQQMDHNDLLNLIKALRTSSQGGNQATKSQPTTPKDTTVKEPSPQDKYGF